MSCWCYECLSKETVQLVPPDDEHMSLTVVKSLITYIVCPTCDNKRCPRATDHRLSCTNSNEPDQIGSKYGIYPHPSIELIDFVYKGLDNKKQKE